MKSAEQRTGVLRSAELPRPSHRGKEGPSSSTHLGPHAGAHADRGARPAVTLPASARRRDVQRKYTPREWGAGLYANERALIWQQQGMFFK